jgi:hypothetical protein
MVVPTGTHSERLARGRDLVSKLIPTLRAGCCSLLVRPEVEGLCCRSPG